MEQVDKGLKKYFPEKRALIINTDSCSHDNTKHAFLNAACTTDRHFERVDHPIRGKGSNFRWLFEFVDSRRTEAVAVVDADLRSITPEWMRLLLTPILNGYDFATPFYSRHKYDGTITNNVCYPLVYGILGMNLRQPIGGDFAFSPNITKYWLAQEWTTTTRQYGIDIFMTLHAILGGFRICEVGLGSKIHNPSAPKLNEMFLQVCGSIFDAIIENIERLDQHNTIRHVQRFGLTNGAAQDLAFDSVAILNTVLSEFTENENEFRKYLSSWYSRLKKRRNEQLIMLSADEWIEILFILIRNYAVADDKRAVLRVVRTLYFARTYTFIKETEYMSTPEAEKLIVQQAERFYLKRDDLFKLFATSLAVEEEE